MIFFLFKQLCYFSKRCCTNKLGKMLKAREDGWGQAGRGGTGHSLRGLQLFDRRVPLEMDTLLFSLTLIGLGYVTQ